MKKSKRMRKASPGFSCRLREIRKNQEISTADLASVRQDQIIYIELRRGEGAPFVVGNSPRLTFPTKVKIENITPVPLVLLVIQA